jgi:hypothetical protein
VTVLGRKWGKSRSGPNEPVVRFSAGHPAPFSYPAGAAHGRLFHAAARPMRARGKLGAEGVQSSELASGLPCELVKTW